jgi:hypothetical protein
MIVLLRTVKINLKEIELAIARRNMSQASCRRCRPVFVSVSERCHIPPISCMDSDESIQNNGAYQLSNSMQF